jgi:hypothetical protein
VDNEDKVNSEENVCKANASEDRDQDVKGVLIIKDSNWVEDREVRNESRHREDKDQKGDDRSHAHACEKDPNLSGENAML